MSCSEVKTRLRPFSEIRQPFDIHHIQEERNGRKSSITVKGKNPAWLIAAICNVATVVTLHKAEVTEISTMQTTEVTASNRGVIHITLNKTTVTAITKTTIRIKIKY